MKLNWCIGICVVLCGCQTSLTNTPSCVTQCCDIPVHRTSAIAWSHEGEGTYLEEGMKKDKYITTSGNTILYKILGQHLEIHL